MLRIWQMHKGELHGAVAELRLVLLAHRLNRTCSYCTDL